MKRLVWAIAFAALTAVAILFTVLNLTTAEVDLGVWSGTLPLFAIVLASLFVGFILGCCATWWAGHGRRKRLRELGHRNTALLRQIEDVRRDQAAGGKIIDAEQTNRARLVAGL